MYYFLQLQKDLQNIKKKKKKKTHRMWPAVEKMRVSMVLVLNKEGGSWENWRWTLNEDLG